MTTAEQNEVWRPTPEHPSLPEDWIFPSVIKPIDGVGSIGVRKINSREEFDRTTLGENELLQRFVLGTPVSVAGTRTVESRVVSTDQVSSPFTMTRSSMSALISSSM